MQELTGTGWLAVAPARARATDAPRALTLAVASGILTWAALPPVNAWPLAFVAWAPLLLALRRRGARDAFFLGGAHGLVVNMLGSAWLPHIVATFVRAPLGVTALIALPFWIWGAGRSAALAWLAARATSRGVPWAIAFALALVATEVAYPLFFPWYGATLVHGVPVLLQAADLGGATLVSALLAGSSVAVVEVAAAQRERRVLDRRIVALGTAAPLLLALYGAWRLPRVDRAIAAAPAARVGIAQADVPHTGASLGRAIELHRALTSELEANGPLDLVIWPETALSGTIPAHALERVIRRDVVGRLRDVAHLASPVLSGAVLQRDRKLYNSAVLFGAEGAVSGVYDKMRPLVFGETLPLAGTFPALRRWVPNAGDIEAGTSDAPLLLGEHRISPLICYESALGAFANQVVRDADPDLLVNLTNDSWFGATSAESLHRALAELRAVEHRRYLVIASNGGASEIVDAAGRVVERGPFWERAAVKGTVRWMRERTLYERIGDSWGWCVAVAAIALAGRRRPLPRIAS